MKKYIIILLFLTKIVVQGQWNSILTPSLTGDHLKSVIDIPKQNLIFSAGSNGTILQSKDGSQTWIVKREVTGSKAQINALFNVDSHIYGVADRGGIYKSMDYGESWSFEQLPTNKNFRTVFFTSIDRGFAAGDSGLVATYSGVNWKVNELKGVNLRSIFFTTASNGYCVGDSTDVTGGYSGVLYRTYDGGLNWRQERVYPYFRLSKVYFMDENRGFIIGESGKLLRTIDGGTNWDEVSSGNYSNFSAIKFIDLQNGYIMGQRSFIKTTDGGVSWTNISTKQVTNDFISQNGTEILSVGDFGMIYKSDLSNSSESVLNDGRAVLSINFADDKTGYVGGVNNFLFKTTDGGESWIEQTVGSAGQDQNYNYNKLFFTSADTGYAANNTFLVKTTDGGRNWNYQSMPTQFAEISALHFISEQKGYCAFANGVLLYTIDGGMSWMEHTPLTNEKINDIAFSDGIKGFAVTQNGTLLKTLNSQKWLIETTNPSYNYNSITFLNSLVGYISADQGLLKTIDGGITWVNIAVPAYQITKIVPHSEQILTMLTKSNKVFRSFDSGKNWEEQTIDAKDNFVDGFFTSTQRGWIIGKNHQFYRYKNRQPILNGQTTAIDYKINGNPIQLFTDISVDVLEKYLSSAEIVISTNYQPTEDLLNFTDQNGISGMWDSGRGILTLTGRTTVDFYINAIKSISYKNISSTANMNKRVISLKISDGLSDSPFLTKELTISAANLVVSKPQISIIPNSILTNYLDFAINIVDYQGLPVRVLVNGTLQKVDTLQFGSFWCSYPLSFSGENKIVVDAKDTTVSRTFTFVETDKDGGSIRHNNSFEIIYPKTISEKRYLIYEDITSQNQESYTVKSNNLNKNLVVRWKNMKDRAIYCNGKELKTKIEGDFLIANNGQAGIYTLNKRVISDLTTELFGNYPNPFNSQTSIHFSLADDQVVKLVIYNVKGELVQELVNTNLSAGSYQISFNSNHLAGGLYFYQLQTTEKTVVKKMILLK